jgi:hypothetical protein
MLNAMQTAVSSDVEREGMFSNQVLTNCFPEKVLSHVIGELVVHGYIRKQRGPVYWMLVLA